jgi:A/G-specific adenine glycosylase
MKQRIKHTTSSTTFPAPPDGAADALLTWFSENKRDLPFRRPARTTRADPYRVWISEIMAQQTQIDTLIPYFERFISTLPTLDDLASASEETVLKLWEGLGYYSRARNLRKAAIQIQALGHFPDTAEALAKLPGIGPYTAGAIASLAFNQRATAVDGNVLRVAARLMDSPADTALPAVRKSVSAWLLTWMPENRPGDFNEALMELGALVCTPKSPSCLICPWRDICLSLKNGTVDKRPVKSKRTKHRTEKIAAAVVTDSAGRLLIHKRPDTGLLAGLWELPNVTAANKKEGAAAIKKHLETQLGIPVSDPAFLKNDRHVFTHITWQIAVYRFSLEADVTPKDDTWVFADRDDLEQRFPLPTAFSKLLS